MPCFEPYSEVAHRRLLRETLRRIVEGGAPVGCAAHCVGYHVGWLGLQCLGLISGLSVERHGMVEDLREWAAANRMGRVMIAGCADFGLLSVVHEAFGERVRDVEWVVADRCPTPLRACLDYSQAFGFEVRTVTVDLMDPSVEGPFELILGHSILSFFEPDQRVGMIQRLAARLGPGGCLSLYQSVRPEATNSVLAYSAEEVQRLTTEAVARLEMDPELRSWLAADQAGRMVRDFCAAKRTYTVASAAEVERQFRGAGLAVTTAPIRPPNPALRPHRAATPSGNYEKCLFRGVRVSP